MNSIFKINNFLPEDVFENLQEEIKDNNWSYIQSTESNTKIAWAFKKNIFSCGKKEIDSIEKLNHPLINIIKDNLYLKAKEHLNGLKIYPHTVYFNFHVGSERNLIHRDRFLYLENSKKSLTLLVYLNEVWMPEWHGATLFYNNACDEYIFGSLPKRNTAILFDSSIKHSIEPFHYDLSGPRVNLVMQFDLL
jgi:Rps23 Pro-64 3,4-dihydroxylase Tpa1-like proline 4-hydroxylase